jgi:hypothetical protein
VKERCICDAGGGRCAPNCPLVNGRNWKDCGEICCQPHERCADPAKSKCVSCEQEGKQTCRSYDDKSVVICCPATRGAKSSCCANLKTAVCCGEKQTCKATGRRARCMCAEGKKCGLDCCRNGETCCGGKECCAANETCTKNGCCPPDRAICHNSRGTDPICCGAGEYCLWKAEVSPDGDPLRPLRGVCKSGCAPGNRAGKQCCGTGYRPNRARTQCVEAPV